MNVYITYEELKEYLTSKPGETIKDDQLLQRFVSKCSRLFDEYTERRFYPRIETRYFDHPSDGLVEAAWPTDSNLISAQVARVRNDELWLDDDLLSATTLTTNNGSVTITSSDYLLLNGDRYAPTPYNRVRLQPNGVTTHFQNTNTPYKANALTGTWGFHTDYANAWEDSQDTVENNPLAIGDTSITVNDADGADKYALTPRFRIGQILRIGSEYLHVTGRNIDANTLTVVRGVNGSTAAAHTQNTSIEIYRPMPALVGIMEMMATHFYRRRHSVGGETDRAVASATGVLILPSRLPSEVKEALRLFKRNTI